MSKMDEAIFKSKPALPNKLLQADGSVTDLAGNAVIGATPAYDSKQALPNKWLNPDGSYSSLAEIVTSMIDNELFIVVDELPASGETNKIYLLVDGDKVVEYIWTNNQWNPVGMVEFDLNNYYTKSEVTQLISTALQSAKDYADSLASNYDPAGAATSAAASALQSAKDYADGLAGDYDPAGAAGTAKTEAISSAKDYTDTAIQSSITQVLGGSY